MKKQDVYYIRAFLFLVMATAVLAFVFARPAVNKSSVWQASSYNPNQLGHKALYTTLSELGWPVHRWGENYRELEKHPGVMIIARNNLGRKYAFKDTERQQLLSWVAQGNRLLLFGDFVSTEDTRALLRQIGFSQLKAPTVGQRLYEQSSQLLALAREEIQLLPVNAGAPWKGKRLVSDKSPTLPPVPSDARILWRSEFGPEIIEIRHGKGVIVWSGSSALLDNAHLRRGDNLSWLLSQLIPDGRMPAALYFEEAHHGFRSAVTLQQLWSQPGLQLALAQIFLGLLVYLTGQRFRFGPMLTLSREKNRSSLEFVRSMARLYKRADLRNETVQFLFRETHKQVLTKLNLPQYTPHDVIARQLKEAFPHLPAWKKLAKRFDSTEFTQGLPPTGWLRTAQDLIQIKKEMI
jgi:hypothetical protein